MKIELVGINEFDGAVAIKIDGSMKFMRPPFTEKNIYPIDDNFLEKMAHQPNFSLTNKEFSNFQSLIDYINDIVHKTRLKLGQDIFSIDLGKQIMEVAPKEILRKYIDRIENELIPNNKFEHAEKLIKTMLDSPTVSSVREFRDKLIEMSAELKTRKVERVWSESKTPNKRLGLSLVHTL